jgi:hypothetical protein
MAVERAHRSGFSAVASSSGSSPLEAFESRILSGMAGMGRVVVAGVRRRRALGDLEKQALVQFTQGTTRGHWPHRVYVELNANSVY